MDFESEATYLYQSRTNRQYQNYTLLKNLEIGPNDTTLSVNVNDDKNTKGLFTRWKKAISTREGKYVLSASGIVLSIVLIVEYFDV